MLNLNFHNFAQITWHPSIFTGPPKEADVFVGGSHNEKDLWIAKYFNDEGELDLDGYRDSNWVKQFC
jgi:hypothetical protein